MIIITVVVVVWGLEIKQKVKITATDYSCGKVRKNDISPSQSDRQPLKYNGIVSLSFVTVKMRLPIS